MYLELDYHFVREKVTVGSLVTQFVASSSQIADIFTKALLSKLHAKFCSKLGLSIDTRPNLREGVEDTQIKSQTTKDLVLDSRRNSRQSAIVNQSQIS